jgi:hypothetical protein
MSCKMSCKTRSCIGMYMLTHVYKNIIVNIILRYKCRQRSVVCMQKRQQRSAVCMQNKIMYWRVDTHIHTYDTHIHTYAHTDVYIHASCLSFAHVDLSSVDNIPIGGCFWLSFPSEDLAAAIICSICWRSSCVYVCAHVCMHVYIYIYTHIHTRTYIHIQTYTRAHRGMNNRCSYVDAYTYLNKQHCIYLYICIYIYIYICVSQQTTLSREIYLKNKIYSFWVPYVVYIYIYIYIYTYIYPSS